MPEGPIILILKEEVAQFKGKQVISATSNNNNPDVDLITGLTILDFKTWGKHFLICFKDFTVRIHLMLFGSYRVNSNNNKPARLHLQFSNGEINFYACSVTFIKEPLDSVYEWTADIMNPSFDGDAAFHKLKAIPNSFICDALLDQHIFSGSGNIIKNEVLFRTRVHPLSLVAKIPDDKLREIIKETVNYSFEFLKWKNEQTLKKHSLAYAKVICPRDDVPFHKKPLGRTKRGTYFCDICQLLYI